MSAWGETVARVLVIDDDRQLRLAMRRMLEHDGHDVDDAEDGPQGLLRFASQPADVVIVDLYMPGPDGWRTLEALQAAAPGIPILLMSGGGALQSVGAGSSAGPDAGRGGAPVRFLRKPFAWSALRAAMAELLGTDA
jgi:CheY-like chemotaxis protein